MFVHCRSGQNRTGVMVAALRIFDGMPIESAVAEMASYGGLWAKQDASYLRTLTPAKRATMEKRIALKMAQIKPDNVLTCSSTGCADLTEQ
jgi:protein-tyrosine phosphatase